MSKYLLAGLLLFSVFNRAFAITWPLQIIEHLDETKIVIYVQEADIESSPTWNPAEGAPSFGLDGVLQTISKWDNRIKGLKDAHIEKIELKPILHQEKKGRWYYLVELRDTSGSKHDRHYLAVLMNGKAFAAIEEPASYK